MVSPISVLFYEIYTDLDELKAKLDEMKDHIQCIVSNSASIPGSISFGGAQQPEAWDYADGVDTLRFLERLA
jgi:hypothetical protein